MKHVDIIIIGNGMVGASLIAALPDSIHIAVIDTKPLPKLSAPSQEIDGRKIALNYGSQQILKNIGVWDALASYATPIEQVHVSSQGQFGSTRLTANDAKLPALGYVVTAEALNFALQQRAQEQQHVAYFCPASIQHIDSENGTVQIAENQTLSASLIIAADGVNSFTRRLLNIDCEIEDYQQSAFISSVQLKHPHNNIAYQRVSKLGTLALLPMQNQTCGFVCTANAETIESLQQCTDSQLLDTLSEQFGSRLGKLLSVGQRFTYPVKKIIAKQQATGRVLLLGNAAHNISPVAAQGYNLGLQDAFYLATQWQQTPSSKALIDQYLQHRLPEQEKIIHLTDTLMRYLKPGSRLQPFIGLGLGIIDSCSSIKQPLMKKAGGLTAQVKEL